MNAEAGGRCVGAQIRQLLETRPDSATHVHTHTGVFHSGSSSVKTSDWLQLERCCCLLGTSSWSGLPHRGCTSVAQ